jgi:hypothetical protein
MCVGVHCWQEFATFDVSFLMGRGLCRTVGMLILLIIPVPPHQDPTSHFDAA